VKSEAALWGEMETWGKVGWKETTRLGGGLRGPDQTRIRGRVGAGRAKSHWGNQGVTRGVGVNPKLKKQHISTVTQDKGYGLRKGRPDLLNGKPPANNRSKIGDDKN